MLQLRRYLARKVYERHYSCIFVFACEVPDDLSTDLNGVIQFKFNTSGVDADDLVSAHLGVYIRDLAPPPSANQSVLSRKQHAIDTASTYIQLSLVRRSHAPDGTVVYQPVLKRKRSLASLGLHRQGNGRWMQFEVCNMLFMQHVVSQYFETNAAIFANWNVSI